MVIDRNLFKIITEKLKWKKQPYLSVLLRTRWAGRGDLGKYSVYLHTYVPELPLIVHLKIL